MEVAQHFVVSSVAQIIKRQFLPVLAGWFWIVLMDENKGKEKQKKIHIYIFFKLMKLIASSHLQAHCKLFKWDSCVELGPFSVWSVCTLQ